MANLEMDALSLKRIEQIADSLEIGDWFYFSEKKKGRSNLLYRHARLIDKTEYFFVAQVYSVDGLDNPTYRECFNYNAIACGDIVIKSDVARSELAHAEDSLVAFD